MRKRTKMEPADYADEDDFYDPNRKQQKEILEIIRKALHAKGLAGAYMVRGAFQPTLELSVPRGKNRRGGVNYTTYTITAD